VPPPNRAVRSPREPALGADALIFPGAKGGPLCRSNFQQNGYLAARHPCDSAAGLHFHDLRPAANHFAASGASLKDQMARMRHDSERGAASISTWPVGLTWPSPVRRHPEPDPDLSHRTPGSAGAPEHNRWRRKGGATAGRCVV
jgi:hypothetical protein